MSQCGTASRKVYILCQEAKNISKYSRQHEQSKVSSDPMSFQDIGPWKSESVQFMIQTATTVTYP